MNIFTQITTGFVESSDSLNRQIREEFLLQRDAPGTRKSHFFHGRYENMYIPRELVPSLGPVLDMVKSEAARQLGIPEASLKIGFWFNEMGPGHATTLHAHDDYDEVMSAVYYITVPEDSGNIVFHKNGQNQEIKAREGMYILFPPELEHEVTVNKSEEVRLSVGINIGAEMDE